MPRKSTASKASADLPWTSTRCLRLLRPLITRIHALRAWDEEIHTSGPNRSAGASRPLKRKERYGKTEDGQDTEWAIYQPRKKMKKTYNARQALNELRNTHNVQDGSRSGIDTTSSQLGMLSVPTPYLNKTLARKRPQVEAQIQLDDYDSRTNLPRPLHDAAQMRSRKGVLIDQMYLDLKKVLEHTTREDGDPDTKESQTGAPSLFSMCLKNVPAYIANEEEWQKDDDDEEQVNVTANTYNQLEGLGQGQERGWKHLKTVVQAHAIHLVNTAIESQILGSEVVYFAKTCWDKGLSQETWSLLKSASQVRQNSYPALSTETFRRHKCIQATCFRSSTTTKRANRDILHDPHELLSFNDHSISTRPHTNLARARLMSLAMSAEQLQPEWLSCPCYSQTWQDVIQSLSEGDANSYVALEFTLQFLLRSSEIQSQEVLAVPRPSTPPYRSPTILEASTRTLTSLCAMLATISLVNEAREHHFSLGVMRGPSRAVRFAAIAIEQASSDTLDNLDEQAILARMSILMTDIIIVVDSTSSRDSTLLSSRLNMIIKLDGILLGREDLESRGIEHLSSQLCDASKCYARAACTSELYLLRNILDKLVQHQLVHRRHARFVRRLALDTAITFAQEIPSVAADAYVHSLEMSIAQSVKPKQAASHALVQSSPATAGRPGFRWEQGVCEWVASTPASLLRLKKSLELNKHDEAGRAAETPCANAIKRWTAPSQIFVGVVVPSAACHSSPTRSGRDSVDEFNTPCQSMNNGRRERNTHVFEDSGIFMDPEDDDEKQSVEACKVLRAVEEIVVATITDRAESSSPPSTSTSSEESSQSPGKYKHDAPRGDLCISEESPPPTRSSRSALRSKSQSAHPRAHRQQLARIKPISKAQLLQDDESEDELSINESDCCAGAFEVHGVTSLNTARHGSARQIRKRVRGRGRR